MDIKQKIKSAWQRMTGKREKTSDSELGADQVVKKEVFPKSTKTRQPRDCKKYTTDKNGCTRKKPSERTRPTNDNYKMIDPSGDTIDSGKS